MKRILGEDSEEYMSIHLTKYYVKTNSQQMDDSLNTNKLNNLSAKNCIFRLDYHVNPIYNEYPVIGLAYNQAIAYCKWRSDRVYEMMLIDRRIIPANINPNRSNFFSIEKVLCGLIKVDTNKLKDIPIPYYRLPTVEEWEYAASGGLDSDLYPQGIKNNRGKRPIEYGELSIVAASVSERIEPNAYKLYNMIGNVSEMTLLKGIAKGGSWADTDEDCTIKNNIPYSIPLPWLGFRCVCELGER